MSLMKHKITILAACFFLISCESVGSTIADGPTNDECTAIGLLCIRVENASQIAFDTFEVNFSGQVIQFGPLGVGQISGYRKVDAAYRYAYTEAFSDKQRFILQPIDFMGEKLLPPGKYTYRYTVDPIEGPGVTGDSSLERYLSVNLRRDRDNT